MWRASYTRVRRDYPATKSTKQGGIMPHVPFVNVTLQEIAAGEWNAPAARRMRLALAEAGALLLGIYQSAHEPTLRGITPNSQPEKGQSAPSGRNDRRVSFDMCCPENPCSHCRSLGAVAEVETTPDDPPPAPLPFPDSLR
jgi:hypothetical protein